MRIDPKQNKDYRIDFDRIKELTGKYEEIKKSSKINSYNVQSRGKVTN
ncbi:MAG: hypothetical protein QXV17_13250 [Candidatus Micrarchaeaceae archaeon]